MRIIAVLLLLAGLLGAAIWYVLASFGHFDEVERSFAGRCAPVTGVAGPEDLRIDERRGRAFFSSLNRRDPDARGAIHIFDVDDPLSDGAWRDVTEGSPRNFRPLGLDYYEDDEVRRLFVVNEATASVELFDVADDNRLIHLQSFSERRLTSPNDVAAVGPQSFYVTNDVPSGRSSFMGAVDFLTRATTGTVMFSDGAGWREVAGGLRFANGLALSPDGDRLYVAESAGASVKVFAREPSTNALVEESAIAVPAAPDNLSIDADGALWIAGHPKPLATVMHEADGDVRSPSLVMRARPGEGAVAVYADDGAEISAASAAARIGATLMIGAIYENKFLLCDLPEGEF